MFPAILQLINLHMRHLDRRQLPDLYRHPILLFFFHIFIIKLDNTPDAAAEQPIKLLRVFIFQKDIVDTQIGETGNINIPLHIQPCRNHIDDSITSLFSEF